MSKAIALTACLLAFGGAAAAAEETTTLETVVERLLSLWPDS